MKKVFPQFLVLLLITAVGYAQCDPAYFTITPTNGSCSNDMSVAVAIPLIGGSVTCTNLQAIIKVQGAAIDLAQVTIATNGTALFSNLSPDTYEVRLVNGTAVYGPKVATVTTSYSPFTFNTNAIIDPLAPCYGSGDSFKYPASLGTVAPLTSTSANYGAILTVSVGAGGTPPFLYTITDSDGVETRSVSSKTERFTVRRNQEVTVQVQDACGVEQTQFRTTPEDTSEPTPFFFIGGGPITILDGGNCGYALNMDIRNHGNGLNIGSLTYQVNGGAPVVSAFDQPSGFYHTYNVDGVLFQPGDVVTLKADDGCYSYTRFWTMPPFVSTMNVDSSSKIDPETCIVTHSIRTQFYQNATSHSFEGLDIDAFKVFQGTETVPGSGIFTYNTEITALLNIDYGWSNFDPVTGIPSRIRVVNASGLPGPGPYRVELHPPAGGSACFLGYSNPSGAINANGDAIFRMDSEVLEANNTSLTVVKTTMGPDAALQGTGRVCFAFATGSVAKAEPIQTTFERLDANGDPVSETVTITDNDPNMFNLQGTTRSVTFPYTVTIKYYGDKDNNNNFAFSNFPPGRYRANFSTTTGCVLTGSHDFVITAVSDYDIQTTADISCIDSSTLWFSLNANHDPRTFVNSSRINSPELFDIALYEDAGGGTLGTLVATLPDYPIAENPQEKSFPSLPAGDYIIQATIGDKLGGLPSNAEIVAGYDAALRIPVTILPYVNPTFDVDFDYCDPVNTSSGLITVDITGGTPVAKSTSPLTYRLYNAEGFNLGDPDASTPPIETITLSTVGSTVTVKTFDGNGNGLTAGDYYIRLTDACTDEPRAFTLSQSLTLPAPEASTLDYCEGTAQVILSINLSPSLYQIVWKQGGNTIGTGASISVTPSVGAAPVDNEYTVEVLVNDNSCGTNNTSYVETLTVKGYAAPPDVLTAQSLIEVCEQVSIQTLNANDAIMQAVPADHELVWYDTATGGNAVANPTLAAVGTVDYYAVYRNTDPSSRACESIDRTQVTLKIVDPGMPVLSGCPLDISTPVNTVACNALVNWTPPTFSANCGTLSVTSNYGPGDAFPVGITQVVYKGTAEDGSTTQCTFNVTVTEAQPDITVTSGQGQEQVGGSVDFDVDLSSVNCSQDLTITFIKTNGTALDADFVSPLPTLSVTIPAGSTTGVLSVPIADDAIVEGIENLTIAISSVTAVDAVTGNVVTPSIASTTATAQGEILDDDSASISLLNNLNVAEGAVPGFARYVVRLNMPVSGGVSVDYTTSATSTTNVAATATAGSDYTPVSGTLNFQGVVANEDLFIDVPIIDDCDEENDEAFFVHLSNVTNGVSILNGQGAITITGPNDVVGIPVGENQEACFIGGARILTAQANVAVGESVVWYNAPTGGSIVNNPTLAIVGAVTYYAEAFNMATGCINAQRVPVTLALTECTFVFSKEGTYVDSNGNGIADVGDDIRYDFVFSNTNTRSMAYGNIIFSDNVLGANVGIVPATIPDVAAGVSYGFTGNYAILQSDIDAGAVYNLANIIFEDGMGNLLDINSTDPTPLDAGSPFYDDQCATCTVELLERKPHIALVKTGVLVDSNLDDVAQVGESINYSFSVLNTGNVTLTDIEIIDGLANIDLTGSSFTLAPNERDDFSYNAVYELTVSDIEAGFVENQALVRGSFNNEFIEDLSDDNSFDQDEPTIVEYKFCAMESFNSVTPNGDGINDFFRIGGLECFPENKLSVFDRWGVKVYEEEGINNRDKNFKGLSEVRGTVGGETLPSGTYFYILTYVVDELTKTKTGYLYLK